jgi:shikimate kinase
VVLLDAEERVLADRTTPDDHRRPVDWSDMVQRMRRRRARLAAVADVVISTTSTDINTVVAEVLAVHASF